jgi:hypothetical protein
MVMEARKLDDRSAADVHRVEMAARQHEAASLSAALRVIARGIEAFALDARGDARQMQWSERLRFVADQNDRRWSEA